MKLYTKGGDDGTTGLFGGVRVPKTDLRVVAYGCVDELNAALAMVITACDSRDTCDLLQDIQHELFVLGAELATPKREAATAAVTQEHVDKLERLIDEADAACPPLTQFIVPGGTAAASGLHFARTVCRRAERATTELAAREPISQLPLIYLNRLSDLLFALARLSNQQAGVSDIPWRGPGA